jgi:rubrerythrin
MNQQDDKTKNDDERLIHGYDHLLKRTELALESAAEGSGKILIQALDAAREKAIELGELTRAEADKVYEYLARDLYDAGQYLAMEERDIVDWLHLGLLVVEKTIVKRFTRLARAARLELKHLEKARNRLSEWHTGEVTTIGTLCCKSCGEQIHFKRIGRIPPCPKCNATVYQRVYS